MNTQPNDVRSRYFSWQFGEYSVCSSLSGVRTRTAGTLHHRFPLHNDKPLLPLGQVHNKDIATLIEMAIPWHIIKLDFVIILVFKRLEMVYTCTCEFYLFDINVTQNFKLYICILIYDHFTHFSKLLLLSHGQKVKISNDKNDECIKK